MLVLDIKKRGIVGRYGNDVVVNMYWLLEDSQ